MANRLKNIKARLGKWFWVILIIIAIGAVVFFTRSKKNNEVITDKVSRGEVREELILTGSVNAEKYAALSFPASGKIAQVYVTEGQKVTKGQALTSLDKTVLLSAYSQTLNAYRNSQAAADNTLDQVKNHSTDESFTQKAQRTAAETARDSAYDALKAASYNLNNATIFAPFNGVVSLLPNSSPGVNVSFTDVQVVLIDPATIYFDVDADQNDVTSLSLGQKVTVILDSFQDKEIAGKVIYISITPKAGVTGTNYKIKVELEKQNADIGNVRIGMTGDAKFILSQKENVLYAPSSFVKSDVKGKYLKVGKPNNKIYLETGLEGEERIEILGDAIKEGDVIYD